MKNYKGALFLLASSTIGALDIPVSYRAPRFQGTPWFSSTPFEPLLAVSYFAGDTQKGYDTHGHDVPFLSTPGSINVNLLASNLDNLTSSDFPQTYTYLRTNGGVIPALNFTGKNGTIDLKGKFEVQELNILARLNILKGFFAEALLPIKHIRSSGFTIQNNTNPDVAGAETFQTFLDSTFDAVLQENGYKSVTEPFKKTDVGDFLLSVGWRGFSNDAFAYVKDITGELALGGLFPTSSESKERYVGEVPFGYNHHWGISARARAQAFFCDYCSIGGYGSATVFFPNLTHLRMKTDVAQSGILLLEKGRAHVNKGALWQLGGYVGVHAFNRALSFLFGYSFTQEEHTELQVDDDVFLSTFIAAQNADNTIIEKSSKGHVVNSARQLQGWDTGTVHFVLSYDTKRHLNLRVNPLVQFFYDLPVLGEFSYNTPLLGGGGGVTISFNF